MLGERAPGALGEVRPVKPSPAFHLDDALFALLVASVLLGLPAFVLLLGFVG